MLIRPINMQISFRHYRKSSFIQYLSYHLTQDSKQGMQTYVFRVADSDEPFFEMIACKFGPKVCKLDSVITESSNFLNIFNIIGNEVSKPIYVFNVANPE